MAYTNKVSAVAAVLFLTVMIAPVSAQPKTPMFPTLDPECTTVVPNLLEMCFSTVRATPTEECCSGLKSATTTQVSCLCDIYIANPAFSDITRPYSAGITTKCGVFDKYSCDGTSKEGEEKKEEGRSSNSSSSSNGKDNGTSEGNGGKMNKIVASMSVFGLVATLLFIMF